MKSIDFSKKPTIEIVNDLTYLEKEIEMNTLKYNLLLKEIKKRFPFLESEEAFKEINIEKGEKLDDRTRQRTQ